MPAVLCGLKCFDVHSSSTAGGVALEFSASLNPALNGAGCPVEVFRLERLAPDAQLSLEDLVVCNVPGWQFDFAALEELHRQLEELRLEHDNLNVQYSRTKEILMQLNASVEANEVVEASPVRRGLGDSASRGQRREVEQLKLQLSQSEKKQQETKATVIALRSEFMRLVDVMNATGGQKCDMGIELPQVMKELDTNPRVCWAQAAQSPCEVDRPGGGCGGGGTPAHDGSKRHVSQPPLAPTARRPVGPMGSPRDHLNRTYRNTGSFSTGRPDAPTPRLARPRGVGGVVQRSGHSAGASMRQRQGGDAI